MVHRINMPPGNWFAVTGDGSKNAMLCCAGHRIERRVQTELCFCRANTDLRQKECMAVARQISAAPSIRRQRVIRDVRTSQIPAVMLSRKPSGGYRRNRPRSPRSSRTLGARCRLFVSGRASVIFCFLEMLLDVFKSQCPNVLNDYEQYQRY
jgi:hypothetical protein